MLNHVNHIFCIGFLAIFDANNTKNLYMLKKLSLVMALSALTTNAYAQSKKQWETKTAAGYTYRSVSNDPMKVRHYTLKNGLSVILSPQHKNPRVQCYITVRAGGKNDPKNNTGLAHYLEHMLFKGTNQYGSLDWAKEKPELDKIDALYEVYNKTTDQAKRKAIYHQIDSVSNKASQYAIANEYDGAMKAMGGKDTNAFTTHDATSYQDDIPSSAIDKYLSLQAERFRMPALRLFHTELEAVYEEKNRGMDSEPRRMYETKMEALFTKHNYGLQTVLGRVEHLKNPSLVEIRNFYNQYYLANNMAVVMAGDFNPDEIIAKIDKAFGQMPAKPVAKYQFEAESDITSPIQKEVVGPGAESLNITFRLPKLSPKEAIIATMVQKTLFNGQTGLIDLDLNKKQKVLSASAGFGSMVDYGMFSFSTSPITGQTLDQAKDLLLAEIEKIKKGEFEAEIFKSIISNIKKQELKGQDDYNNVASSINSVYMDQEDWLDQVNYLDELAKITKADVQDFANKQLQNNYVVVYKRKGETPSMAKIEKPSITPIQTNAGQKSAFLQSLAKMPENPVKPVFLDFNKDFQRQPMGTAKVYSVQNKTNQLFRLAYRYKIGSLNDPQLAYASNLAKFLSTKTMSADDISKAFYKLACSYNISVGEEYTTVSIEGLQENFHAATKLYETILADYQKDEQAQTQLKSLIARTKKSRQNNKSNKSAIIQGLANYAMYGPKNKFNTALSNTELEALEASQLIDKLQHLNDFEQTVIYYGPLTSAKLVQNLQPIHPVAKQVKIAPVLREFKQPIQSQNQVLFADYDMVQAEVIWISNSPSTYQKDWLPAIKLYNNYFGQGMSSVVFQNIRESQALAYTANANFITPNQPDEHYINLAYIGTQADKFDTAIKAMNTLSKDMPMAENQFLAAKNDIKKDIETQRITEDEIIYNFLNLERLGIHEDRRANTYQAMDRISMQELKNFQQQHILSPATTYCVVASDKKITQQQLEQLGTVKKLSLEEIFGY
jgi:predicted Zn-dependent peptidase